MKAKRSATLWSAWRSSPSRPPISRSSLRLLRSNTTGRLKGMLTTCTKIPSWATRNGSSDLSGHQISSDSTKTMERNWPSPWWFINIGSKTAQPSDQDLRGLMSTLRSRGRSDWLKSFWLCGEGLRRSTVAHFARKVRETNIVATKHELEIQQRYAPERWSCSLRVRGPHSASKVSYNAGAATDDYATQISAARALLHQYLYSILNTLK